MKKDLFRTSKMVARFLVLQVGFQKDWRSPGRQDKFFFTDKKRKYGKESPSSHTDMCDDMCGPVHLYPRGGKTFLTKIRYAFHQVFVP